MNRLVLDESERGNSIKYVHQFRCDVDVFIMRQQKDNRDWDLRFQASSRTDVPAAIRSGLIQEFINYVRRRTKNGMDKLSYDDFIGMAKAVNIL